MLKIKDFTKYRMNIKISNDPLLAEDTISDHNNVDFLMNMTHTLKILELIILILNITYFLGITFMIVAELNMTIAHLLDEDTDHEFFISYFGIHQFDKVHKTILMIYYTFTSLTTIGLGDLYPKSDVERIFCSIMLIFGVAIFSYFMSILIEVLEKSKASAASLDKLEMLSRFFGLIKHFNKGKTIEL